MTLTITHTHADGTEVAGTRKGDGSGDILKAHRFTWRYGAWRIRGSRDRMADRHIINQAADALRAAGFDVTVIIDDTPRDTATVEAERAERAADRADRYEGYATNAATRADAAYNRAQLISDGIPFGQPILVGHHSERRARRDRERLSAALDRSATEVRKAEHWQNRAHAAEATQSHRENLHTTIRRVERLEAERRDIGRRLAGASEGGDYHDRLTGMAAQLDDQIGYWRGQIEAAKASGVKVWGPDDFTPGDWVGGGLGWMPVLRVNAKTLTVPCPINIRNSGMAKAIEMAVGNLPGSTRTLPYGEVTGRRAPDETTAILRPSGGRKVATTGPKAIRRGTKRAAELRAATATCEQHHHLRQEPKPCDPAEAWALYDRDRDARLIDHGDRWVIDHGLISYVLRGPATPDQPATTETKE